MIQFLQSDDSYKYLYENQSSYFIKSTLDVAKVEYTPKDCYLQVWRFFWLLLPPLLQIPLLQPLFAASHAPASSPHHWYNLVWLCPFAVTVHHWYSWYRRVISSFPPPFGQEQQATLPFSH